MTIATREGNINNSIGRIGINAGMTNRENISERISAKTTVCFDVQKVKTFFNIPIISLFRTLLYSQHKLQKNNN